MPERVNRETSRAALPRREARLAEGRAQAEAERAVTRRLPTRAQLMLPLLHTLEAAGGAARPGDVYNKVADEISAPAEIRSAVAVFADGQTRNVFERQVRHAQQLAKLRGLIEARSRGEWSLTEKGLGLLQNARRGVVLTVFATPSGIALWGHVEDAMSFIEAGSVQMIFTSPPYPILRDKEYDGIDSASWISWMLDLAEIWKQLLAPGGSLFMSLSNEIYRRGAPFQSTYLERFIVGMEDRCGYQLAQRWQWDNPAKLASIQWASIARRRLKQTIEPIYWWVNTAGGFQDAADNRAVLQPYTQRTRERYIGQDRSDEARIKPSGIDIGARAFARDNGGAIPSTLIRMANSGSNSEYRRACRAAGIKAHPATFPDHLPDRAILLTTRPGDLIFEPFMGSGTVPAAAERLGRRWIGVDRSRAYLEGASLRFANDARGWPLSASTGREPLAEA